MTSELSGKRTKMLRKLNHSQPLRMKKSQLGSLFSSSLLETGYDT